MNAYERHSKYYWRLEAQRAKVEEKLALIDQVSDYIKAQGDLTGALYAWEAGKLLREEWNRLTVRMDRAWARGQAALAAMQMVPEAVAA